MKVKQISISELIAFLGADNVSIVGNAVDCYIDNLADVSHTNTTTLDWINPAKTNKQAIAEASKAKVMLVDKEILPIAGKVLLVVENPKVCLAKIGNAFFSDKPTPGIHSTAIVDPEAKLGKNVCIGPYSVIGKATIGEGTVIESHVRIYDDVRMGKNCHIKDGAILGGAGFGFEKDENGNRFRFPQIGSLIMGDEVEVGGNTCIDRGALSDTIIGSHTKINNLCHIAHNNVIGENVEITGCVNVSGGNVIDDNVWLAPNSSLVGYIHIGEGAVLGMGAVAVKDIPAHEVWVGNPAKFLKKK